MSFSSGAMGVGLMAIFSGLLGAWGLRHLLHSEDAPAPASAQIIPLATADLPQGRVIRLGDIGLNRLSPRQIAEMKLAGDNTVMLSAQQIVGRVLLNPVQQGQPFRTTDLYLDGGRPDISELLKPGYRAITVPVPGVRGGALATRSVVDVIFRSFPVPEHSGYEATPQTTVTLFEGVEVLAVDIPTPRAPNRNTLDVRRINGNDIERVPDPQVTLAVTPEQANVLRTVEGKGDLTLIPRSPEETFIAASRPAQRMTFEELLGVRRKSNFTSEIYRRGSRQTQTFDGGPLDDEPARPWFGQVLGDPGPITISSDPHEMPATAGVRQVSPDTNAVTGGAATGAALGGGGGG